MPKGGIIGLLTVLGLTAQFASGQLEPDCNPLQASCQPKKALPNGNYYIDFTKQTSPPQDWIIANDEAVNFTSNGAELVYAKQGDAPSMWTNFYMLGGRYDIEMKIAPGQGVISSAALWSDTQDEIDYEFSGNQFGQTPFPPQDGMWAVETNVFAQGKMWDGAATYQKALYKPAEQFHKYSVEWDEDHMNWYVDDKVVRTIQTKDTPSGFAFPQSPMKLQLGVWGGGDPSNSYWTKQWAGGEIDLKGAPYTMYVKSVSITNKYPACQYRYNDKSGKISSIEKITDGCTSSDSGSQTSNPPRLVKNDYPVSPPSSAATEVETGYPTSADYPTYGASSLSNSQTFTSAQSPSTYQASPPSSHSTASSPVEYPTYPVSSPSTSHSSTVEEGYPTSKAEPSSSSQSSASIPVGYPTSQPGSSSATAHSSTSSLIESYETYPAASVSSASHSDSSTSQSAKESATSSTHSSSATISDGYPVSPPVSSQYSTSSPSSSGYPMSPPSSSRGFLSSLSSLILGTTSSTLAVSSSSEIKDTYPTASLSSSASTPASSSGGVSSSVSSSSQGSSSGYPVSSFSASHSGISSSVSDSTDVYSMSSGGALISTVYSTNIYTVTSCPPTVTDCPVGKVTTEIVSVSTTMSSATEAVGSTPATSKTVISVGISTQSSSSAAISSSSSVLESASKTGSSFQSYQTSSPSSSSRTMPSTYSVSSEITTSIMSTVYSTDIVTITSCPPSVTNCPVGQVTTETKSLYTTICPVTHTVLDGTTYSGTVVAGSTSLPSTGFSYSMSSFHPSSVSIATSSSFSSAHPASSSVTSVGTSSLAQNSSTGYPVVSSGSSVGTSSSLLSSSSHSSMTTPAVSVGTSSSILSSGVVYQNSTASTTSGSALAASSLTYPASSETVSSSATRLTTSTVYSTNIYTITSCAPTVTNCPARLGQVTTELVSLYTTICPVTESQTTVQASSSALPVASQTSAPYPTISSYVVLNSTISSRLMTTSTVYTSSIYTVSSCKPGEAECSSKIGSVTTETVPLYTTVCPVEETETALPVTATSSSTLGKSSATQVASSYATSSVSNSQVESSTYQAASSSSYETSAQSHTAPVSSYMTSTVYSTRIYTVTSCAPSVTNCPAKGSVTTEIVAVSTTVCPVSDKSKGVPDTSVPAATGGSQYSTATVTLSNTLSGSVIVVTSTISFIDTPIPYPTQAIGTVSTAGTAAIGSSAAEAYPNITKPATTVTLGNYFTTTIEYDTITPPHGPPASVSSGAIPTSYYTSSSLAVDVPSYQMSEASSTVGMNPTSVPVAVSPGSSYPMSPSHSDDTTTLTSSTTNTRTVYQTRTGEGSVASTCACDAPTVTVTVTSTVQPPFPSGYATGTGADTYPTSTPGVVRKWFRRDHGNGGGH